MRLFSWYGISALVIAACCGYVAGVAQHTDAPEACCPAPIPSHEEESLAPPAGLALSGPRVAPPEVIDLTCPPNFIMPFELLKETAEPPMADAGEPTIRRATFEVPAGPVGVPFMPYLDD
jgi:hypothetical protein